MSSFLDNLLSAKIAERNPQLGFAMALADERGPIDAMFTNALYHQNHTLGAIAMAADAFQRDSNGDSASPQFVVRQVGNSAESSDDLTTTQKLWVVLLFLVVSGAMIATAFILLHKGIIKIPDPN